jgi:hypothetical protein
MGFLVMPFVVPVKVSLEPVAVRAQRPEVARAVVVPVAVDVVHVKLATVQSHESAVLAMVLLVRQLRLSALVDPRRPAGSLAGCAQQF